MVDWMQEKILVKSSSGGKGTHSKNLDTDTDADNKNIVGVVVVEYKTAAMKQNFKARTKSQNW